MQIEMPNAGRRQNLGGQSGGLTNSFRLTNGGCPILGSASFAESGWAPSLPLRIFFHSPPHKFLAVL